MKTVELTIPTWNAAIPAEWDIEFNGEDVSGTTIAVVSGQRLTANNEAAEAVLTAMVEQGMATDIDAVDIDESADTPEEE